MIAITLLGAGVVYRLGQADYLLYIANPVVAAEIANETTAFAWNIMLDEPYPGPAIGDDAANGLKLLVKGISKTKVAQKFVIPLGKLNFVLGEGTTVLKDLSKVKMKEIENMAKSLIRGEKFKEQGIKTSEDIARFAIKAFDEGVDVSNKTFKGLRK